MSREGRPKSEIKRDALIRVRVSETEKSVLKNMASQCNLSLSDYIRNSAMNKTIRIGITPEELDVIKDLSRLSAGLGKISNLIKDTYQAEAIIEDVLEFQGEIRKQIDRIYDR